MLRYGTVLHRLQEAAVLKQQYDTLNEVLEGSDTQQMLNALLSMRKSMDTLARVPEYAGVSDKVAMLEARIKGLAVPQLANAIRDQNGVPDVKLAITVAYGCCASRLGHTRPAELFVELSMQNMSGQRGVVRTM